VQVPDGTAAQVHFRPRRAAFERDGPEWKLAQPDTDRV
jgi:hypothetical protein